MSDAFRPCVLVPTYDNPETIEAVVMGARARWPEVVVVDDGSHAPARAVIDGLVARGLCRVERRATNGGKGAAVKDGLAAAQRWGYSHALQIDGDGQHSLDDIPRFLGQARLHPKHLVLGQPRFDASVPRGRLYGRKISVFWAWVETFGDVVGDPLCGFRVYPVAAALAARARGQRMDFDPEIVVRMAWNGVPVLRLPTRVRYVSREDGGVSHFQMVRDNVRISWMHTRLVVEALVRRVTGQMRLLPPTDAEERS